MPDDDADAAFGDEVHTVGGIALRGDDLALANFQSHANRGELRGKVGMAECLLEPFVQSPNIAAFVGVSINDGVLAYFERPVEIVPWRGAC